MFGDNEDEAAQQSPPDTVLIFVVLISLMPVLLCCVKACFLVWCDENGNHNILSIVSSSSNLSDRRSRSRRRNHTYPFFGGGATAGIRNRPTLPYRGGGNGRRRPRDGIASASSLFDENGGVFPGAHNMLELDSVPVSGEARVKYIMRYLVCARVPHASTLLGSQRDKTKKNDVELSKSAQQIAIDISERNDNTQPTDTATNNKSNNQTQSKNNRVNNCHQHPEITSNPRRSKPTTHASILASTTISFPAVVDDDCSSCSSSVDDRRRSRSMDARIPSFVHSSASTFLGSNLTLGVLDLDDENDENVEVVDLEMPQSIEPKDHGSFDDAILDESMLERIRARMNGTKSQTEASNGDTPTLTGTCSICLSSYVEGDVISWSKNPQCVHAFHKDCIVTWLMKHGDCPCCRSNYFFRRKSRSGSASSCASGMSDRSSVSLGEDEGE